MKDETLREALAVLAKGILRIEYGKDMHDIDKLDALAAGDIEAFEKVLARDLGE